MANQNIITHQINDAAIFQRESDGFFNATAMCRSADKKISHYRGNENTKEFLEALSHDAGIPASKLIEVVRGRGKAQGTWVNPNVAIHLAQWLNPDFAVGVTKLVMAWMNGGKVASLPVVAALPDTSDRHVWMTLDADGRVIKQVDLDDVAAVSARVDEYYPEAAMVERDMMLKKLDDVMYHMMVAQNEVRKSMNPLFEEMGVFSEKTQADFWRERWDAAAVRVAG